MNTSDSDDDEITVIPETSLDGSSDGKTDNEEQKLVQAAASISIGTSPVVTHTVTFKCIRSTIRKNINAGCERGEAVPCTLEPEPNNPVDYQAITFKCKVDGAWYPILDALSKHGLGKEAGKKGGKAKPPQKSVKQDSAITVKQVDGLKGMMSNTTNLYSSASEPGLSHVLTPSGCASPFTYHPAPVNEPVPSHPFPQSSCALPFVHSST